MTDETSSTNGKIRSTSEKPEERRKDGRPTGWWKKTIKMCFKGIIFEGVKGIIFFLWQ